VASEAADWDTILGNLRARILEVTASPNPDYSIAGRSFSKGAYLAQLNEAYLKALQYRQQADGPFEVRSVGY